MKIKLALPLLCLLFISCERGDIKIFDARPMFSSNMEGNWILINYWADWCPPCIKEIPEINSFAKLHPEVIVLAYNFDRLEEDDLRQQIKKFGINYPSLITANFRLTILTLVVFLALILKIKILIVIQK